MGTLTSEALGLWDTHQWGIGVVGTFTNRALGLWGHSPIGQ